MKIRSQSDLCRQASGVTDRPAVPAPSRPSSIVNRQSSIVGSSERGIALVITLIMLAVTLVMAVAFLAVARRETGGVDQQKDNKTAQLAAETAAARAQVQIVASMLSSLTNPPNGVNGVSSNAYNLHLFVSTNYINPIGFRTGISSPTNVNYYYNNGLFLTNNDLEQNIANLMYLPRAPVFVPLGTTTVTNHDFRFYLDLNENGNFEPNGMQPVISDNPNYPYYDTNHFPQSTMLPGNVLSNFMVGDPEWVGILAHPDSPHGVLNPFLARYAFIALPAGNALDINYIHNEAWNNGAKLGRADTFMRNQGVGSWELNLAAFLADLNTNVWSPALLPAPLYYSYNEPNDGNANSGYAFQDALSLLNYRYYSNSLPLANRLFINPNLLRYNNIDNFSRGPLQTTLDYYRVFMTPPVSVGTSWSGADSTNHYFSLFDWLDGSKTGIGTATFTNRLRAGGTRTLSDGLRPTYDNYTFYRMLDQLASDSSPDDGRLNLNYSNAVVYADRNAVLHVNIIPGAETNLMPWAPTNFFLAAADQLLRNYSSFWYNQNPIAYTNTYGITNSSFSLTNIPVVVSNRFVYTPAVNRLLQLAANIYDATTNHNFNLPHVYRPLFKGVRNGNNIDVFVIGYIEVNSVMNNGPNGPVDPQFSSPFDITQLGLLAAREGFKTPLTDGRNVPINVYGVPWIIGAKKGLPNFNQLSLLSAAQVTRKLEITRSTLNPKTATYTTNQAYIVGVSNQLGMTFWNSYSNTYFPHSGALRVVIQDSYNMFLTNSYNKTWSLLPNSVPLNIYANVLLPSWRGASFLTTNWSFLFQTPTVYNNVSHNWLNGTFEPVRQLDQMGLAITNYLQAYILDGNNVIDYVQLRAPITIGGLNQALLDSNYPTNNNIYLQWSINTPRGNPLTPYGVIDQLYISGHPPTPYGSTPANQMPTGGQWSTAQTPMGVVSPEGEAAYFNGFFNPSFSYGGKTYVNRQLSIQAPYTPSRTIYTSFLLQANDPLVHYLGSDLNAQPGSLAIWANKQAAYNGLWAHSDDPLNQPMPTPPVSPVGGRYQPWGSSGQMAALGGAVDANPFNLAYKDPRMFTSDYWDFPTNQYPTVGWLGRVHRGTPWQTVYLKSTNILDNYLNPNGYTTWAAWTGNSLATPYFYFLYFDANNSSPQQDFLLFDIFTTRYNDNSVRGTLPVNVGMGRSDGGLAAWSALFSGMTALTNTTAYPLVTTPLAYNNYILNPAGVDAVDSPLWKIVNGPNGINATRANTNLFPSQVFTHAGQVLAAPALTVASPFLNTNGPNPRSRQGTGNAFDYGLNDEMYEWLPQQMMGLVRGTEQRYVLYCFGQTLRPVQSGGRVLGGTWDGLVTNYQVTAESVVRAVVRVDNANTTQPRAIVESYNVLPPY